MGPPCEVLKLSAIELAWAGTRRWLDWPIDSFVYADEGNVLPRVHRGRFGLMRERVDAEEVSQLIEGEGWWFGAFQPSLQFPYYSKGVGKVGGLVLGLEVPSQPA